MNFRIARFSRASVRLAAMFAGLAVLMVTTVVAQQSYDSKSLDPLVGTWIISVRPIHCKVAADCSPFTQIENYNSDGTLVAFDSAAPPSVETISLGPWKQIGPGKYTEASYQFVLDDNGNPGTFIVRAESDLNAAGDAFSGRYTYKWVGQDGKVIDEGDGFAEGSKITLEDSTKPGREPLNLSFRYRASPRL
jgi:hypothetical protein